jgi:hypothetical protein
MGLLDGVDENKVASDVLSEFGFEESNDAPETVEAVQQAQTETLETNEESQSDLSELDNEFQEAERRISKATLYRQLIRGRFFDGEGDLVLEVEAELKEFVKKQYLGLSGISQVVKQVVEKDFSNEEVLALKSLAERIIKSAKDKPVKTPQLQPRAVSKTDATIRSPITKKQPQPQVKKPQLQVRRVPEEAQQNTLKQTPKPSQKTQPVIPAIKKLTVPPDESILEENGQKYRIKYVGMPDVDEFGIMDGGKIRKLQDKQTCVLSNGIQVFKNGASVSKVIKTAVVSNANVPGRLPFPSSDQITAMSESNAIQAANKLPPTLGSILGR